MLNARLVTDFPSQEGRSNSNFSQSSAPTDFQRTSKSLLEVFQRFTALSDRFRLTETDQYDFEALYIAEEIKAGINSRMVDYEFAIDSDPGYRCQEGKVFHSDQHGMTAVLFDVNDRFFGVIPTDRMKFGAPMSASYEVFENPVRLVGIAQTSESKSNPEWIVKEITYQAVLSDAAFLEMVNHLADIANYVKEEPVPAGSVPQASQLYDMMMNKVGEEVAKMTPEGLQGSTKIKNLVDLVLHNKNQYDVEVEVEYAFDSRNGKTVNFTRTHVFEFCGALNMYGSPVINWRQEQDYSAGRAAGKTAA